MGKSFRYTASQNRLPEKNIQTPLKGMAIGRCLFL